MNNEQQCEHKNLKYFSLKDKVICLGCGNEWYQYSSRISEQTKQIISKMRKEGATFEDIGKVVGVSRQRIHQIYRFLK